MQSLLEQALWARLVQMNSPAAGCGLQSWTKTLWAVAQLLPGWGTSL
jgi:hypothetical protein